MGVASIGLRDSVRGEEEGKGRSHARTGDEFAQDHDASQDADGDTAQDARGPRECRRCGPLDARAQEGGPGHDWGARGAQQADGGGPEAEKDHSQV